MAKLTNMTGDGFVNEVLDNRTDFSQIIFKYGFDVKTHPRYQDFKDKMNWIGNGDHYLILDGSHLNGVNLQGIDLRGIRAVGCAFERAHLEDADLSSGIFANSGFTNAYLNRARMCSGNFYGASFDGANLTEADMSSATLEGANFKDSILVRVKGIQSVRNIHLAVFSSTSTDEETRKYLEEEFNRYDKHRLQSTKAT